MLTKSIFNRLVAGRGVWPKSIVVTLALLKGSAAVCPAAEATDYAAQINQARLFSQALMCVGTNVPSASENQELYRAAGLDPAVQGNDVVNALDSFVKTHPDSAWAPSLQANLANYYRTQGRYSVALEYWDKVWSITKRLPDANAQQVADYTLANWSQLLSSLGRAEKLTELINEVGGRPLSTPEYQRQFDVARQSAAIMKNEPGVSYRCGSLALYHVAKALGVKTDFSSLMDLDSPATGFPLAQLMDFSEQYQMGLAAVKRPMGGQLVVPSVVHWNESHYAAIVSKRDGAYEVIDPTFGKSKWLSAQAINENASGIFIVPTNALPKGWLAVSKAEAQNVFGKGLFNGGNGNGAGPNCPSQNPCTTCPTQCTPPSNGGSGNGKGPGGPTICSTCNVNNPTVNNIPIVNVEHGMPTWEVQEPYISLWLHDIPMLYNMSFGRQFSLALDYHQRETRPVGNGIVNFGPGWNCNWLTYIEVNGNVTHTWQTEEVFNAGNSTWVTNVVNVTAGQFQAAEYSPDGGEQDYSWGGASYANLTNPRTHVQLLPTTMTQDSGTVTLLGLTYTNSMDSYVSNRLAYPNGSVATFGLVFQVSAYPVKNIALLTAVTDPQGHVMRYLYTTNSTQYLLTQVVDFDGNTNQLLYGNTNFPTVVTQITNTANRLVVNLKYDNYGYLTNITDVIGISSSFVYSHTNDVMYWAWDYTNNIPVNPITNSVVLLNTLRTPYGDTKFDYFHPTWPLFTALSNNDFYISAFKGVNRAITVTQPDNGKHLFLYRDIWYSIGLEAGWPAAGFTLSGDVDANFNTFLNQANSYDHLNTDNSFYWGPRQYAVLSTATVTNLSEDDFTAARSRNWLHSQMDNGPLAVSQTLNVERSFAAKQYQAGSTIWYGYDGKGNLHLESTNNALPLSVGNYTSDSGSARIENVTRNSLGNPTARVVFGWDDNHNLYAKTNRYVYAANGIDLLRSIGPDGVVDAAYLYNGNHQVTAMTNALNEVTRYTYNANEQLTSIVQPNGQVTTNIYNTSGFLEQTIVVGFSTNAYTYTNGLVLTHTDERGLTTTNSWDALQRLTKITYPDGTSVSYCYTNTSRPLDLVKVTDRMNFTTSYTYDTLRRRTEVTNALGYVTHYNYCNCGLLDSMVDALGNPTYFSYDLAGRQTNTTYADGFRVGKTYNRYGSVTATADSSGNSVNNYYDGEARLVAVTNTVGGVAAYAFDVDGLVTNSIDANGVSVGMTYDPLHRLKTRSYPDGGVEKYGYAANVSGPTGYTNQIGNIVLYGYDTLNRKTNEIYIGVTTNKFAYNGAGDLLKLTDGKNQNTLWGYDGFGRVTNKMDDANNLLFVYKYDPNNRLTNRWSAAKGGTAYSYDAVGNLTKVDYPVSPDILLKYDKLNRLTNLVDAVGTTLYGYDAAGQLLSEDGPWASDNVNYSYASRLRTGMSVAAPNASAWSQGYGYDSARRLTGVTSLAGEFDYFYNPNQMQQVDLLTLPGGAYITNTFDSVARLTGTYLKNSGDTNLDSYAYTYNQANQRTQVTRTAGDYVNYSYDTMGQLKTAIGKEAGGVTNRWQEQFGYAYDAAGNLNFRTNNALVQTFNVNSLNELTTTTNAGRLTVAGTTTSPATNVTVNTLNAVLYADVTFAATNFTIANGNNTFTAIAKDVYGRRDTNSITVNLPGTNSCAYDLNGNLLTDGTRYFAYDDENQLISVWKTNAWRSDYVYDGKMRRRIVKEFTWNGSWVQTNEVHYVYDGNLVVQERSADNLPLVTYTRGTDLSGTMQGAGGIGGLLARTENAKLLISDSFASALYHADGNGNVTCLIYTNQTIAAKYLYDPYGNMLSMYGSLADANSYRFSSKEWNANSGLYYYLYRLYDPNVQRWENRDPLGERGFKTHIKFKAFKKARLALKPAEITQNPNLFNFVGNIPASRFDRFGLQYDSEHCNDILRAIDHLFTLKGRIGFDDNEIQKQINDLQDEYDDNCGDDDGGSDPIIPPLPSPCPTRKPQPAPSFCQKHPAFCAGVGVGVGVAIICIACPECCVVGVIVGAPAGI